MPELKSQDRIWQHFQNAEPHSFEGAKPRQEFLIRQVRRHARPVPRVLNIGVGDGYLETRMHALGWDTWALDPDPVALGRLEAAGITTHCGYAEAMPFADASFDFVIATEVLEHLRDDQRAATIAHVARVLAPGGRFLGTVPYREDLAALNTVCPECGVVFHRWGHCAAFDEARMRVELSAFVVERTYPTAFVDLRTRNTAGRIKGLVRLALARAGSQIAQPRLYFRARKN